MANNMNTTDQQAPQIIETVQDEDLCHPGSVSPEDLELVTQWVKNDLFDKVRFLYNQEHDLRADGPLHKLFIKNCKRRLVGLRLPAGGNDEDRRSYERLYMNMLWTEANKKKRNLVAVGLTVRRSSVYSAMQNRFIDLSNFCGKKKAIFPSIEAFEMRINIPGVYFIFYDYFFKSSAGDAAWKKASMDENKSNWNTRLASEQSEAFAMLVLKNNYFAWLLSAKEKWKEDLVTDYDSDVVRKDKKSCCEAYLGEIEIDLDVTFDDDDTNISFLVSKSKNLERYNDLKKTTDGELKKAVRKAKENPLYKNLKKELNIEYEWNTTGMSKEEYEREDMKKRRKLMKSFRAYTMKKNGEDGFKGWSKRAADDMASVVKALKEQGDECRKFSAAYREVCLSRNKRKRNSTNEGGLINVDYDELWDLEKDGIVAV